MSARHENAPPSTESAPPSLLLLPQTANPNYEHSVRALHVLAQVRFLLEVSRNFLVIFRKVVFFPNQLCEVHIYTLWLQSRGR